MSIDEEIKIKQNAQEYYEKDLSYNQVYRQGVIDGYAKGIDEFANRLASKIKAEIDDCADELDWIDKIAEEMQGVT